MKRSPLKKQSKTKVSLIQKQIWELCKQITRNKYGNVCYTCGAQGLTASNWHTGHMWAKASLGAYLKYDLRILRPQCYKCNIHHGGMGAEFYRRMLKECGSQYMEDLEKDRQKSVKAIDHYLYLFAKYQTMV